MFAALSGLIAGMGHVWSGADHLAAIAPLAAHKPKRAWIPGLRWGIGHFTGVAIVGLLSLWLRDLIPVDLLSTWGERLVGVMLLAIGLWGLRKAFKNQVHTHEHEHGGDRHVHVHVHAHKAGHERPEAHGHHSHAAVGIGLLHGVAGTSHFLGVLPMLAFPTRTEAVTYLVAFGIGTILSMAGFSWAMGQIAVRCSVKSAQAYQRLTAACSVMAMGVGCYWLMF